MVKIGPGEKIVVLCGWSLLLFIVFPLPLAVAVSLATFAVVYKHLDHERSRWQRVGIAGPKSNIFLGNMLKSFKGGHVFMDECFKKYGCTFGQMLGNTPDVTSEDLDLIKQIFIKEFDNFPDRFNLLGDGGSEFSLRGNFLTIKEGDEWRRIRHRITPAFTSGKMKRLIPMMNACVKELTDHMEKFAKSGKEMMLKEEFSKLTLNVIGRAVFASNFNCFNEDESNPVLTYSRKLFDIKPTDPLLAFTMIMPNLTEIYHRSTKKLLFQNDVNDFFMETLTTEMNARLADPEANNKYHDAFQLMLNVTELNEEEPTAFGSEDADILSDTVQRTDRKKITRLELLAQLLIFLAAGHETTAATLHWACFVLSIRPDIQQRLRDELDSVVGDRADVEYEDLSKLEYLNQVINETLRMFPPAARINRLCQRDTVVNGIPFRKGDSFTAAIYNIHHNPNNYPDPDTFDPERFAPEQRVNRHPMAFLPFGGGPRICLGMRFADFELRVTLAQVVRKFRLLPAENMPSWPIPLSSTVLLKPMVDLACRLERV